MRRCLVCLHFFSFHVPSPSNFQRKSLNIFDVQSWMNELNVVRCNTSYHEYLCICYFFLFQFDFIRHIKWWLQWTVDNTNRMNRKKGKQNTHLQRCSTPIAETNCIFVFSDVQLCQLHCNEFHLARIIIN